MSLANAIVGWIDSRVRARGKKYFDRGRVSISDHDESSVSASVRGSALYDVFLNRGPGKLTVSCTCPYFDDGAVCKHIWAAILAADAFQLIQPSPGESSIALSTDDDLLDQPWDADIDEWAEEDEDYRKTTVSVRRMSSMGWAPGAAIPRSLAFVRQGSPIKPPKPSWKDDLARLKHIGAPSYERWPAEQEIVYQLDVDTTLAGRGFTLRIAQRLPKLNGGWRKPKPLRLERAQIESLPDHADRKIMGILTGVERRADWSFYGDRTYGDYVVSDSLLDILLPMLCETGRFRLLQQSEQEAPLLRMDEGAPWVFRVEITRDEQEKQYVVKGFLARGDARMELTSPALLVPGGWVLWPDSVARLDDSQSFNWIAMLRRVGEIRVPFKEGDAFVKFLYQNDALQPIVFPDELRYEEIRTPPQPRLTIKRPPYSNDNTRLFARLRFNYQDSVVDPTRDGRFICLKGKRAVLCRDTAQEERARTALMKLGVRPSRNAWDSSAQWELPSRLLPRLASALIAQNWMVEADGRLYKKAGKFNFDVSTGVDWFELRGAVDFDGVTADLPALIEALKHKEGAILLSDGTIGMLPEEWLRKYGALAAFGSVEDDHLRFQKNQAGLLDALLAAQPEAKCDEMFESIRAELREFQSVKPRDPAPGFTGILRDYQRDGLGWLHFLQKFGFGGCLADDMGLGKTVQTLAILESRRALRAEGAASGDERIGPSLAVVPRSLIFNWRQEAARFTPGLRILDHTGHERYRETTDFSGCDLVLTTYGTLRRDIAHLKDVAFDYVILDEAQAIKNADAQTTKAARLLKCRHRLALSGTPVQNHLGELWSLFEFLNPGMLGTAAVFRLTDAGARDPAPETRELLSRALRPFILRRAKAQVERGLPDRTEKTVYCELDAPQRELYDELRDHYRRSLLKRVDELGLNKSKIMILEALLRLRQAACHPGLIDPKHVKEPSAKLETLLPQLAEVMEENHKALVFSQFTSLLAIVRERLDKTKVAYEYLDGSTRDRETPVRRFQTESDIRLFLISLKAGGLGLNLTAAEYVFLLDPWWNPAVEMQAIDRAHRIGQTRQVFAYRLIARDTVEEKVLELQKTKKDLADSIINVDNSLIRNLRKEDLELLLG